MYRLLIKFMDDILKYAVENGIIDLSYVQDKIEMNKREEILKKHPWHIGEGKDGKWRTYLPDEKKGRKMIKRNSQSDLEDAVVKFYKELEGKDKPKTFEDTYWHWRSIQDALVMENSISKYNTDYKRYFKNTDFSKKEIREITEEDIKVFIVERVKSLNLCKKACKTLFGYISNTINSARINKLICENPMEFLKASQFYKYCTEIHKPPEKAIISDEDMKKLYQRIYADHQEHPEYIPTYAVEFATLTGMRVGEISALKWDCIMDDYIIVNKSEKYNRIKKEYFIDKTKNRKERIFPLTDEIRSLLRRIKSVEIEYGYICEWVFANANGRIHAPVISSCSKNKCQQIGIDEKGIYAYRKTLNSKMKCCGVSTIVAASLLGHTEDVNEKYYTFDISSLKEKTEIISQINRKII